MEESPILPKAVLEATWARVSAAQKVSLHQTNVIGLRSESPRGLNFERNVFTLTPLSEEERAWVMTLVTHAHTQRLGPVRADELHRISYSLVNATMSTRATKPVSLSQKLLKRTCERAQEIAEWRKSLSSQVPRLVLNKTVYWVGRDKGHRPILFVDITKAGGVTEELIEAILVSLEYARVHLYAPGLAESFVMLINVVNYLTEALTASSIFEMAIKIEKFFPLRLFRAYSIGDSRPLNLMWSVQGTSIAPFPGHFKHIPVKAVEKELSALIDMERIPRLIGGQMTEAASSWPPPLDAQSEFDPELPLPLGVSWFVEASKGPVPYRDKEGRLRLDGQPLREGELTRLVSLGDLLRAHGVPKAHMPRLPHLAALVIPEVTSRSEMEEDFMSSSDFTEPKKKGLLEAGLIETRPPSPQELRQSPVAVLSVHIAEEEKRESEGPDLHALQSALTALECAADEFPLPASARLQYCDSKTHVTPRLISVRSPLHTARKSFLESPKAERMVPDYGYRLNDLPTPYGANSRGHASWLCACLS